MRKILRITLLPSERRISRRFLSTERDFTFAGGHGHGSYHAPSSAAGGHSSGGIGVNAISGLSGLSSGDGGNASAGDGGGFGGDTSSFAGNN